MTSSNRDVCSLPKIVDPAANKSVICRKISARDAMFLCEIAVSSSSISDWREAATAARPPPRWRRSIISVGAMLCGIFDFRDTVGASEINFRRLTRRLEQEALQRCNAGKAQQPVLIRRLDAFRRRLDIQAPRERKRRRNDRSAFCPLGQILGERLVDLDLVKREHQQLAQRGISRSEVVQRDRDAEILELPQNRQTFGRRLNKSRFCYLEFQAFRRQAGLSKRTYHDIDQVVLSELDGGEIDRHLDVARPGCSFGAGCLHQPLANL